MRRLGGVGRLIPAHAGSTLGDRLDDAPKAAHPRSRGEHDERLAAPDTREGSSPLTRGAL